MNHGDEHTKPQEAEAQPAPAPPVQATLAENPSARHSGDTATAWNTDSIASSDALGGLQHSSRAAPAPMAPPMYGIPPQPARPPGLPCPLVMPAQPGTICRAKPSRWNVIVRFLREARGRQRWQRPL
jgi:hypothetical protein